MNPLIEKVLILSCRCEDHGPDDDILLCVIDGVVGGDGDGEELLPNLQVGVVLVDDAAVADQPSLHVKPVPARP